MLSGVLVTKACYVDSSQFKKLEAVAPCNHVMIVRSSLLYDDCILFGFVVVVDMTVRRAEQRYTFPPVIVVKCGTPNTSLYGWLTLPEPAS